MAHLRQEAAAEGGENVRAPEAEVLSSLETRPQALARGMKTNPGGKTFPWKPVS